MHLTHGRLLHGELASVCISCDVPFTMSHILVECLLYCKARLAFHLNDTLSDMLGNDRCNVLNVMTFLNATGFARLI
jgi:hypothetical protein